MEFIAEIKESLKQHEQLFKDTLILNPVENIPPQSILYPAVSTLHGLYNSDKIRTNDEKLSTKIQFSGRDLITSDVQKIYDAWGALLNGNKVSMRFFSGLHAHMVVFMCMTNIGDTVMILPEEAGGHMATHSIFKRLGLNICHFVADDEKKRIDIEASMSVIEQFKPKIIFFDRSEGLIYEDVSWIGQYQNIYKIFDASQYLTNIIANDYINPFDWGFDAILSTLHKNLPGPQRALFCSRQDDDFWKMLKKNISIYVSNMHVYSIYSAGLLLEKMSDLICLSHRMLSNTIQLELALKNRAMPIIERQLYLDEKPTHHIWLKMKNQEEAFDFYLRMEQAGLLVNYRLLPFSIGYGIRMGLSGGTYSGLDSSHLERLAEYIADIYFKRIAKGTTAKIRKLIQSIKANNSFNNL